MNKKLFLILIVTFVAMAFMATGIYAGTTCPDKIEMKTTKIFPKHKKAIVVFDHKKHEAAKPDGYGLKCGECHHDKDHKPLNDLKPTDKVKLCTDCHKKPGKASAKVFKKPSKKDLEKYYVAIHVNCISCHKKLKDKKAPTKCSQCHPRKKKK
ncbi:MAG: cytochrome c3 family protein [Deltaproteobacteria bacterium]|nr:cytochrome c3 family protein [Deltaproteobacteria bacterium]